MNEDVAGTYFYAKVLLFGEYSLMVGSGALTVPFTGAKARFCFPDGLQAEDLDKARQSNKQLARYSDFLAGKLEATAYKPDAGKAYIRTQEFKEVLDLDAFLQDLEAGMYFHSDIPAGYGLGSSGALVAAVYASYARQPVADLHHTPGNLLRMKSLFADMESFFHGKSSGIDPLSCYAGRPLLFHGDGSIQTVSLPITSGSGPGGFFLIDTAAIRKTESLVRLFLHNMEQPSFRVFIEKQYVALVDQCIASLMYGHGSELGSLMHNLSGWQLVHFAGMIPSDFIPLWEEGSKTGLYSLKLCGAGGGGYLLGFTRDYTKTFSLLEEKKPRIGLRKLKL